MTQIPPSGSKSHDVRQANTPPDEVRSSGPYQQVVLVADDEPLLRNLVTLLMQQEDYFVLSAADGLEALELSRQYPSKIDLLITDLEMPGMNGNDLCARLTEERPLMKTLYMSGADMSEIIEQNANMPFLPKPFSGDILTTRVRAILGDPLSAIQPHP